MKTRTTISDITKEDLVNLLSTALYGSTYLSADYDAEKYKRLFKEGDCYEDKMARILLEGGEITVIDGYAEDEDEVYSKRGKWDKDLEEAQYTITLKDIEEGLQKALDGTFKLHEGTEQGEKNWARKVVMNMMSEDGDYDLPDADMIMQINMFGEIVYG